MSKYVNREEFRAQIARLGVRQSALATAVGVHPGKVTDLLNGKLRKPVALRLRAAVERELGLPEGGLAPGSKPSVPDLAAKARAALHAARSACVSSRGDKALCQAVVEADDLLRSGGARASDEDDDDDDDTAEREDPTKEDQILETAGEEDESEGADEADGEDD